MTAQVNVVPPVDLVDAMYDQTTLALELFGWMEALSQAICSSIDNGHVDRANRLAAVAQYISTQQVDLFESTARELTANHGIGQKGARS